MLEFTVIESSGANAELAATLAFAERQKSRLKIVLDSGEEAGIVLAHGTKLRAGDVLGSPDGVQLRIAAALEPVSTVAARNGRDLARICYHLGNRHVPLQIGTGWARYERDHVLDAMVTGLGFTVIHEQATFEPEHGAYAQHGAHAATHHAHD
tara:strand:+ start:1881 stop:2339 length:459 start_codon:yes stop_codon:yes gene_type:complete